MCTGGVGEAQNDGRNEVDELFGDNVVVCPGYEVKVKEGWTGCAYGSVFHTCLVD